jgi:hypothetical protein
LASWHVGCFDFFGGRSCVRGEALIELDSMVTLNTLPWQELRAKRKAGEKLKNKGSGFGGKGFKFDEAEQRRLTDAAAKTKKLLLIQNGEEVSEEEDAAAAAGDAGDDFEEQAANLNAQYHQKVPREY